MAAYFFRRQRRLGINETVVPLDVIDAFESAMEHPSGLVLRVNEYPKVSRSLF